MGVRAGLERWAQSEQVRGSAGQELGKSRRGELRDRVSPGRTFVEGTTRTKIIVNAGAAIAAGRVGHCVTMHESRSLYEKAGEEKSEGIFD